MYLIVYFDMALKKDFTERWMVQNVFWNAEWEID